MKKITILSLMLVLALALSACGGVASNNETKIGTSEFSIVLPAGYASENDNMDEDQIAYFYKDDNSIDFDVYQWEKGDRYTLESEADAFAALYGTTAESVVINGINGKKYVTEEEFDGNVYTVVNYMFEDDVNIIELCFWTVGSTEELADVDTIINTLKKN